MKLKEVDLYTDGGCSGNPGPGGCAAILIFGDKRKEISIGFKHTTNNRMELRAVISGLEALKEACRVNLYADSKYVLDSIRKGWLNNWQKNGWKTSARKQVENKDLWQLLVPLLEKHTMIFHWVEGHAGNEENECADELAVAAYRESEKLLVDEGYKNI